MSPPLPLHHSYYPAFLSDWLFGLPLWWGPKEIHTHAIMNITSVKKSRTKIDHSYTCLETPTAYTICICINPLSDLFSILLFQIDISVDLSSGRVRGAYDGAGNPVYIACITSRGVLH